MYGRRLVLEFADEDDTIESLRKKTAEHFHGMHIVNSVFLVSVRDCGFIGQGSVGKKRKLIGGADDSGEDN